jgi:hypothetical protein
MAKSIEALSEGREREREREREISCEQRERAERERERAKREQRERESRERDGLLRKDALLWGSTAAADADVFVGVISVAGARRRLAGGGRGGGRTRERQTAAVPTVLASHQTLGQHCHGRL